MTDGEGRERERRERTGREEKGKEKKREEKRRETRKGQKGAREGKFETPYRKILVISPGLTLLRNGVLGGLINGGAGGLINGIIIMKRFRNEQRQC